MPIPLNPLANRPRADPGCFGKALYALPALNLPHNPLSTKSGEVSILVNVHPVLRKILKPRQLQLPRQVRMDNLLKAHN